MVHRRHLQPLVLRMRVRHPAASPSKRSIDRQTATGLARSGLDRFFFVKVSPPDCYYCMYLMALIAAEVPAPTAVVTCILPPVTSPAAKTPGMFVA